MSSNRKDRRAAKKNERKPGDAPIVNAILTEALHHQQAGRFTNAEQLYRQVLMIEPANADALHLLGVMAYDLRQYEIAAGFIGRAIASRGDIPYFHNNLGNVRKDQERPAEAVMHYQRALSLKPDYAEALNNLGNVLKDQKKPDEALPFLQRALTLDPDRAEIQNTMGAVLRLQGKFDEAMVFLQRALTLKPDYAEPYLNIGGIRRQQGSLDEAIAYYQKAITLKPDFIDAYLNLGQCLHEQNKFGDAVACYEHALSLKPNASEILNNLGGMMVTQGRLDEGIAYNRRALAAKPDSGRIYGNLLLNMIYAESVTAAELAATARDFGRTVADPLLRQRPLLRDLRPDRKLRIGYVSPDFYEHPVNYFFEGLLKHHDRNGFEIFAYSNTMEEDAVTARLKPQFDHWRDIRNLDDDAAADLVEADRIDILVDLAGHTGYNRLLVFARKPAPVQVTWLGYPATTGMAAMDYRITDNYAEPPGLTEHLNTETLWRLPRIFCCYQPPAGSPAVIDHPPFEDNGTITFGCFSNFARVSNAALRAWGDILRRVPESRLLLEIRGVENPEFRAKIIARLEQQGLPVDRVILEPRKKSNQYVLYNRLDIVLDPFPAVGGTTSMDIMWMGVPLITLAGEQFLSRLGVTILTNVGLPELIAGTVDDYIEKAAALALDRHRLQALRRNLRDKAAKSPLMNQPAFARDMETAYREMWRLWCSRQAPKSV